MNVILSGGDVGKTTFLEAIALLLSPSNSMVLAEADYWQRNADAGFTIRAAISLPASSDIGQQAKFAWATFSRVRVDDGTRPLSRRATADCVVFILAASSA